MSSSSTSGQRRFRDLPRIRVLDREVPVARSRRSRLLGLARLDRSDAGPGLLIPRCRSIHTFGMRFAVDVVFLGHGGRVRALRRAVPPRRVVFDRAARLVLEVPAVGRAD